MECTELDKNMKGGEGNEETWSETTNLHLDVLKFRTMEKVDGKKVKEVKNENKTKRFLMVSRELKR